MRYLTSLLFVIALFVGCGGQNDQEAAMAEPEELNWLEFSEVQSTFPTGPLPTFLYVSQSNCRYCSEMDSTVFSRPEIARYLNAHYRSVNVNVNLDLPITIQGKEYDLQGLKKLLQYHGLPAYYFFDTNGQIIGMLDSSMPLKTFKQLLVYVENRHFMRTPWEQFLNLPEANVDTIWNVF